MNFVLFISLSFTYLSLMEDELVSFFKDIFVWKFNEFNFIINKVFMFNFANIYGLYSLI